MCISHSDLNQLAAQYASKTMNCGLVLIEHQCFGNSEIIDVAGFRPDVLINIEVKVQRKDFTNERKKPHRKNPTLGAGDYRFYCAPVGLIQPDELSARWGLLEYHPTSGTIRAKVVPPLFRNLCHFKRYQDKAAKENRPLKPTELETIAYAFKVNNQKTAVNCLYSAFRQIIQAQEQGLEYEVDKIFKRPQGLVYDTKIKI